MSVRREILSKIYTHLGLQHRSVQILENIFLVLNVSIFLYILITEYIITALE